MDYDRWQLERKRLSELVRIDKSQNWKGTYPPHQVAVTEMAIRELYDRVEALEMRRGPGRPPKDAA
jgi:hypothetical protein